MNRSNIAEVRWHRLRVTPKTVWTFVELVDGEGRVGTGEATLGLREAPMDPARFEPLIQGKEPASVNLDGARAAARSLPEFAIVSALDQALWDLTAQQRNVTLSAALGTVQRDKVPLYANINRGIEPRTEAAFAAQARRAIADGFTAIKIAPFDGVELYGDERRAVDTTLLDAGLARIAAVREAIGPHARLMVDCHWRLNRTVAEHVLKEVGAHRLYWLECPVPDTPEMLATLRHLRGVANASGIRLAGCEELSLVKGFAPFMQAGAYDVMMPDVKYVGGLREMLRVAQAFEAHGVAFSPHNPTGPVCHAASIHVCAVAPLIDRLEMQYAETPLFDALVGGALPRPTAGEVAVPQGPGLGVRLDARLVRELAAV